MQERKQGRRRWVVAGGEGCFAGSEARKGEESGGDGRGEEIGRVGKEGSKRRGSAMDGGGRWTYFL